MNSFSLLWISFLNESSHNKHVGLTPPSRFHFSQVRLCTTPLPPRGSESGNRVSAPRSRLMGPSLATACRLPAPASRVRVRQPRAGSPLPPMGFLFHIWFDFYVPSTYCTTTFYLDLIINMQSSLNWWILKLESSATCYLDNDGLVFKYAIMLSRTDLSDAHFKLSEDVHAFASLKAHAFLQQVLLSFQEEALAFDSTTYSSPSFPMAFLKVFTFWRWIFFNYNCNVSCSIYSMHV